MKKTALKSLFLYKNRYILGYIFLACVFALFIVYVPKLSPAGLSLAEKESVVTSYNLHFSSITTGDLVDLPYHILQKISILIFGMTTYSVKIPSILMAIVTAFAIIALLNRWFRNNVALLASILTTISIPFLYLAGSGTPLIMLVFWPIILLWLGSKIQGEKNPSPYYCLAFGLVLMGSIFTPYMIYLDIFIVIYAFLNPHLRHTIKTLPRIPFVMTGLIVLFALVILVINVISQPEIIREILFSAEYQSGSYLQNLRLAFEPLFSWGSTIEGVFLTPLISLPILALSFIGLMSTVKGLRASRNSIALIFLIFTCILSGFNPDAIVLIILPLSVFVSYGIKYTIEKWYNLFPDNPYARFAGLIPLSILIGIVITSCIPAYVFGYRYTPAVAMNFDNDLDLVINELEPDTTLVLHDNSLDYRFYEVYEDRTHAIDLLSISGSSDKNTVIPSLSTPYLAVLNSDQVEFNNSEWILGRIITSQKSDNSDRIYVYKKK